MNNKVYMTFWDVQHGNALHIRTPNDKHLVIDLGIGDYSGSNQQFSPLNTLLQQGITNLYHVTITHPHLDHFDDILNFDRFYVNSLSTPRHITDAEILANARVGDKPKFDKYLEVRTRLSNPISSGAINDVHTPENLGGVKIQTFMSSHLPNSNFNNHSILTVLEYSNIKIIIPGDNEYASLDYFMTLQDFREAVQNADILLAPHHGRESAYHAEFVKLVDPLLTIVSDGSVCETSANQRYSANSRGYDIYDSKGNKEFRRCLTTNCDGEIFVEFGPSHDPQYKAILGVTIV
jgi:beta-lactamase superfamily II metal-dependent hydrolase